MEKKYVVLEIQTMDAALSNLPRHAAVLMTSDGSVQMSQYYEHGE